MKNNPYQSPVDTKEGIYDHWLRNRILKCVAALLLFFVILDWWLITAGNLRVPMTDPITTVKIQINAELDRLSK